jgi:HlyD family secretion protein
LPSYDCQTAYIISRTSGKIQELYVANNQEIKGGDYIAVIDNPAITEDVLFLKSYLNNIDLNEEFIPQLPKRELRVGSLQSLYASLHTTLFEYLEYQRLSYFPQRIAITEAQISRHEEQYLTLQNQQKLTGAQLTLAQSQFRRDSVLHTRDVISNEDLERAKNAYLQSLLSVENMRSALGNMRIQIAQLRASLLDMHQQDTERGNELRSRIRALVAQLKAEIQSWELMYVLQSPIDGAITFTGHWTENQNVLAGETVFTVVPHGLYEVMGKAQLPIARSGKVETGQKVNVRLHNFPENEYGILRGVVSNISLVPVQAGEMAYYTVEISLPEQLLTTYKKELPRLPNMQGQADIITDDISLLERFVLPIKKILSESVR